MKNEVFAGISVCTRQSSRHAAMPRNRQNGWRRGRGYRTGTGSSSSTKGFKCNLRLDTEIILSLQPKISASSDKGPYLLILPALYETYHHPSDYVLFLPAGNSNV